MPTVINIPDVGPVSFPDSMDDAAIEAASAKLHSEHVGPSAPAFKGNPARNQRQAQVSQSTPKATEQQRRDTVPDTSNPLNPTNYVYNGVTQAGKGAQEFKRGDYTQGISDMMRGVGTTAAPFALPTAAATAPLATLLGIAGSGIGSAVTGGAARALGASDGVSSLAEDAGSIVGGSAAMGAPKIKALAGDAVNGIGGLMSKVYDFATHPVVRNAAGVASPKVGKAIDLAETLKNVYDAVKQAQAQSPAPPAAPQLPEIVPPSRQLGSGPLITPAPVDTSGIIHGWSPTILQHDPTPTPGLPAPKGIDELLADLRKKLEDAGALTPGQHLGEVRGGRYPKRFAGDDSPVIDSYKRKPDSTAPIANPETITRGVNKANKAAAGNALSELPENSVLLKNPKALQAAITLAELMKGAK